MPSLFPFQLIGAQWLAERRHALLADDMGLGKSAQVVRAADIADIKTAVVVCPAVARINWTREFAKFSARKWVFGINAWKNHPLHVAVTSYEQAGSVLDMMPPMVDLVVADESQYLKSPEAQRSQAVLGKSGLIRRAKRFWALSGTPAPNHAGELWTLLYTLGVTPLNYDQWVDRYCEHGVKQIGPTWVHQIYGTREYRIPELKAMLAPIMLRRKKEKVMADLPPITMSDYVVEAGPVDEELYFPNYFLPAGPVTRVVDDLHIEIAKQERALSAALDVTEGAHSVDKDRMSVLEGFDLSLSTLRRYVGLQKVPAIVKLVDHEIESGDYNKLVIFARHRDVIVELREKLKHHGAVILFGGTPPAKRQMNIDKFQNDPKCKIFIGQVQAAGTAITLTAAHNVIMAEADWVPGNNAQAIMRCHRIGQTKPVTVRFISLANSSDEVVMATVRRKTRQLDKLFG